MTLTDARAVGAEEWLHELRKALADDRTPALALLNRTEAADLLVIGPMEDIPTVPTWSKDRMVLIGDAAHATSPSSGQGASLAVESAVQLARCLRDLPHEQAFAAYEQLRRTRVEKIIAQAARTDSDKAAGPILRVVRDLLMPVAMKRLAKPERMAWQFDYHIDWSPRSRAPLTRSRRAPSLASPHGARATARGWRGNGPAPRHLDRALLRLVPARRDPGALRSRRSQVRILRRVQQIPQWVARRSERRSPAR
jgi:hypothetical protein